MLIHFIIELLASVETLSVVCASTLLPTTPEFALKRRWKQITEEKKGAFKLLADNFAAALDSPPPNSSSFSHLRCCFCWSSVYSNSIKPLGIGRGVARYFAAGATQSVRKMLRDAPE